MTAVGFFFRLAAVCLSGLAMEAHAGQVTEVDLQLVVAADVSGSMSISELRLQREGYVDAFRQADVAEAILSGALGRVAVTYVEWAGRDDQVVVMPWTVLADGQDIADFTRRLAAAPVGVGGHGSHTALSSGLLFCAEQFGATGLASTRKTIDVSGDGIGDDGPPIARAREQILGGGITINGLSVDLPETNPYGPFAAMFGSNPGDVHAYYRDEVIGGPSAFVMSVHDLADFPVAIEQKLVLEIASR
jgi:Protein of unknown function (DUF1194)